MRKIFIAMAVALATGAAAQNPFVQTWCTSDPAPLVVGDRMYVYTGHDEDGADFFWMQEWRVYSTDDMVNWVDHGSPLALESFSWADDRAWASQTIERNGKFYWYICAHSRISKGMAIGVAVSDSPTGPFQFLRSQRIHANQWPFDMDEKAIKAAQQTDASQWKEWWNDAWRREVNKGMYLWRDMKGGQMSRDMTVYVDDDGKAYHITSSQENLTLLVSELTDDYLNFTGKYNMVAPGGQNEAPCIFKHNGTYWLICSGCTGWSPNEARMFSAKSIWGPWKQHPSPFVGTATGYQNMPANKTFGAQGTYIYQMNGKPVFMADIWNPRHLSQSLHLWLPIEFNGNGVPVIRWADKW